MVLQRSCPVSSLCIKRFGSAEASSGHELATEKQLALAELGLIVEPVGLAPAGTQEMDHGVAAGDEELRDQPPVAAPPKCLGAHEAGRGLGKLLGESFLPLLRPHPCGVTAEGADPDAGEALLARLAGAPPAELDGMAVRDTGLLQPVSKRHLVELRVAAGAGEAAHVDQRLDADLPQRLHELVERTHSELVEALRQ